jgi:anhydro-N-acetylmuramic acid kinase
MKHSYSAIGIMSGTSLDGLDIVFCTFGKTRGKWGYDILFAETTPYPESWRDRLSGVENGSALDLALTDAEYGHYIGIRVRKFMQKHGITPDLIASHGHTIFHQPERGMTLQIGQGSSIAAETGIPVVSDFRSLDVALGGQGAPLVPAGDRLLFGEYDFCLNLGGFANISYEHRGKRIGYDICPVNMVLNRLAAEKGDPYDKGGCLAAAGKADPRLLKKLNDLPFYSRKPPKSLGKEWVLSTFWPVVSCSGIPAEDKLHTLCMHIAQQVSSSCRRSRKGRVLVTGGGAWNTFLVEAIRNHSSHRFVVPDPHTVNYKEALIFAFLGVLRMEGEANALASSTGAGSDNSGGAVWSGRIVK